MPCTRPRTAYQPLYGGKLKFTRPPKGIHRDKFDKKHSPIEVQCNECYDCINRHALDWSVRQYNQAQLVDEKAIGLNLFVTYTYKPEELPDFGFYNYQDIQKAHKRLRDYQVKHARKHGIPKERIQFKFAMAPEYGDTTLRAHYHGNYYNLWLPDLRRMGKNSSGRETFQSDMLEKAWQKGLIDIQSFGMGSATYVGKHNVKQNGESLKLHLKRIHFARRKLLTEQTEKETGIAIPFDKESGEVMPEKIPLPRIYASNRPAIGRTFYEKFKKDIYPRDYLTVNGQKFPPPKYYDRLLLDDDPELWFQVMEAREENRRDWTSEQLRNREEVKRNKYRFFARPGKL